MEIKYFKITSKETNLLDGYGIWKTGDGINYKDTSRQKMTFCDKVEYETFINTPPTEAELALSELLSLNDGIERLAEDWYNVTYNGKILSDEEKENIQKKLDKRNELRAKLN